MSHGRRPGRISFEDRHLNDACLRLKETAALPVGRLALPERIHHQAVPAPERKCYRVIRWYTVGGSLHFEDIGAFKQFGNALSMAAREQGRTSIVDPDNKTVSINGQPIESREV